MHYNTARAQASYTENHFSAKSPEELIAMLYEGIIRFNNHIKINIENNNREKSTFYVSKSVNIFLELISSLNFEAGVDISAYLYGLYVQEIKLLNNAVLKKDTSMVDEVSNVVRELLSAWRETTGV